MGSAVRWLGWLLVGASLILMAFPGLAGSSDPKTPGLPFGSVTGDSWLPLGTDRWGIPFQESLARAAANSGRMALCGTLAVLLGALLLGTFESGLRSASGRAVVQGLMLGAMAIPDVTLLMTIHAAVPREMGDFALDVLILAVVGLLWIPTSSRLVASRVKALRTSLFYRSARASGAGGWHLFRRELLPNVREDLVWLFATAFPRFLHVELGLAYIGVEYRSRGLGLLLKSSYEHRPEDPYTWQLILASLAAVWLSLLPMVLLRLSGVQTTPST